MRDLMNFCRLADDAAMLEKMFCVGGSLNAHPPVRTNREDIGISDAAHVITGWFCKTR